MSQSLAMLLSIAIEAGVAFAMVEALGWGNGARAALAAVVGTLATHWLAWWTMLQVMDSVNYWVGFFGVETGVVLAESIAYFALEPLSARRSLCTSLVANGASLGFGLALYALDLV